MRFFKFFRPLTLAACLSFPPLSAMAQDQGAPAPVVAVEVLTPSVLAASETFNGRVEAESKVDLRARSAGFVEAVHFDEGGSVTAGQVLFEVEPDAYEAAVTQIKGQIQSAQAEETLAQIEVDRQQTLFERGTSAENVLQQAQAALGNTQGVLMQLQGVLRQAKLNLSYTRITAPFAGRIGFTNVDVGAYVGPDSGALVTLTSVDPIFVSFPIAEARVLDLRKQHPTSRPEASLELANGDIYALKGEVIASDATINTGTDTLLVRAEFPNPDGALQDGQLVRVRLTATDAQPVLSLPLAALQRDQAGYFVMIVNADSAVEKRIITVDRFEGTRVVPADGLASGDQVVVEGIQRIRPGLTVQARAIPGPADAQAAPQGGE